MERKHIENSETGSMVSELEALFSRLVQLKIQNGRLWFGISGSWRKTNQEIENSVRLAVREIMNRGDGIVSGGALGVDFYATDEALRVNPTAERIRVFLPVSLELYAAHYRKRATENVITSEQAEALITQLQSLHAANPSSLVCNPKNTIVDQDTYFERNTAVVSASDALVGFQVNNSGGVEDTVNKAIAQGKLTYLKKFVIE
jgi:hypothetical protein